MAELAIRLRIFVSSPSDVQEERALAEAIILDQSRKAARFGLFLDPFLWEKQSRPGLGRPQDLLNPELTRSELTVVIFWSRLGSPASVTDPRTGTVEELTLSETLVRRGQADDVFVYFRDSPPPPDSTGADVERVRALRLEMSEEKAVFFRTYNDPSGFRQLFSEHLESWLSRWQRIPEICRVTLHSSSPGRMRPEDVGENRLDLLRRRFDPVHEPVLAAALGRIAIEIYQKAGPQGIRHPIDTATLGAASRSLAEYLRQRRPGDDAAAYYRALINERLPGERPLEAASDGSVYFADPEWFYLFCALGLIDAVKADRTASVECIEYVNDVHSLFAALVDSTCFAERPAVIGNLRKWLKSRMHGPIVRNYAAYVLGTIGAQEAQDDLAASARFDSGKGVRMYAICSLGKLRCRRHLDLLVDLYTEESDDHTRLMAGQAICRIIGIADFAL